MKWLPWRRGRGEARNLTPVSDPVLAAYFAPGGMSEAGTVVGEGSSLALSAVWRAVALISGTIAQLPLRSLRETRDGAERVRSIFDAPDGPDGQTRFEWVETLLLHLLLHGNGFLRHQRNGAGALLSLQLIHPLLVRIELPKPDDDVQPRGGKWFVVTYADGITAGQVERLDAEDMTHIPAMSTDGVRGISPITAARLSLGTAIAGDRSAAKLFSSGALISGIVTPEDDLEGDEAAEIKRQLNASIGGYENAGQVAVVNRRLKFTPWTMSAADAQFLQSRQFSVEEIARWFGVPPHLLMQTDKQTSWGSGVAEQNDGLARYCLAPWTARIEQRLSRLLPNPRFVEFDFAGLKRPTVAEEIRLLLEQTGKKPILSVNEARAIRNLPPVEGGDTLVLAADVSRETSPVNSGEEPADA